MGIAVSLQHYLEDESVSYEVMSHERTVRSSETAKACSIAGSHLAKGVLVKCEDGFLLAVVPASRHVRLDVLGDWLQQPVGLATEAEAALIFADCERGSIPPVGVPYGLTAVMDETLDGCGDVYFEGGDHRSLVHLNGDEFQRLMDGVPCAHISGRNH